MYTRIFKHKTRHYKCEPNTDIIKAKETWWIFKDGKAVFKASTLHECREYIFTSDKWEGLKYDIIG